MTTSEDQAQDLMDKIMGAGVDLNPPDAFLRGFVGLEPARRPGVPRGIRTSLPQAGGVRALTVRRRGRILSIGWAFEEKDDGRGQAT